MLITWNRKEILARQLFLQFTRGYLFLNANYLQHKRVRLYSLSRKIAPSFMGIYLFLLYVFFWRVFLLSSEEWSDRKDNEKNKYSHGNHGQKISLWDHYFMHKNLLCFIRLYKYPDQMSGNTIIDYLEKDIGFLEFEIEEKYTCTTQTLRS